MATPRLLILFATTLTASACQREIRTTNPYAEQHVLVAPRAAAPFPPQWTSEEKLLHTTISNTNIDTWSSYYTHGNHIAGLNKTMAEVTAAQWTANGVPSELVEYEIFVNYPEKQRLMLKSPNATLWDAQMYEDVLAEDETSGAQDQTAGFHGYSASGIVEGEYVYVGRGHKDDFAALKAANITVQGKIALAKYGGVFRGLKVQNAEANGMIGVVIFSDPGDDGPKAAKGQAAYPNGPARQPSSIQRGSVAYINQYTGDPTTPGRPSKPDVERDLAPINLPKIPSLPISYRDAIPILQALDGHGASAAEIHRNGWTGGLNATYSTGPAPGVTLSLTNLMDEKFTPVWNVIGVINGTNSNETIIIGNHRDAWIVGGAADPNSGSAILNEISRALGELLKTGWKPKRNIIMASWDAEEYGIVGSTEWVEEFAPWLSATAMTYLNLDIAVSGPLPGAGSTPELRGVALDVMKKVIYGDRTLWDAWQSLYQFMPEDNGFDVLGSGSDYTAFLQLGIGALDFGMSGSAASPVYHYHSNYDSYHWMKTFVDPSYALHTTTAQFITLLTYTLSNSALYPFDLDAWARNLEYYVRDLIYTAINLGVPGTVQQQIGLDTLDAAVKRLHAFSRTLAPELQSQEFLGNATRVENANRAFKTVQRLFVRSQGLPGRPFYKNALVAPNKDDGYAGITLPASMEALNAGDYALCKEWNAWVEARFDDATEVLKGI